MSTPSAPILEPGSNKEVLVNLPDELKEAEQRFPRLADYTRNIHAAIDARVRDRFMLVDARTICSITEDANLYFAAHEDLRHFENDPRNTARVFERLDAIAGR